jgi:LuxR family transcriptional regulator, maltose regulon positive regulatory protein
MPVPILATKLFIPSPRPELVRRERLLERLDAGLGRGLILVSASAGFGKTSLLSAWLSRQSRLAAWLSLDQADGDPNRFLAYLLAALRTVQPGLGEAALAALSASQPLPLDTLLTGLLNELSALPEDLILVLDDYHCIDSKEVDAILAFLVDHLPRAFHLVIASREDPPLPLARLRARGQLTELRVADLRFTPEEAADFLNRMGLNLSTDDVAALDRRTEGWIAGLQMAALAMLAIQGEPDFTAFIQSFSGSHRFVLDYLLEEVIERQPAPLQAFLLRTSILERLCGPLCEALLDWPSGSGQSTLETLERANLFLVPLDHERRWYRYHHLFGELLRRRLGQSWSPEEIAENHLRASQWYEKNGDGYEAFQHAFAAADFQRSAALAEAAYQGMDNRFQTAAWIGWVKKLPVDVVRIRPILSVQMARAFMDASEPEASESYLQDAERCLNDPDNQLVVTDDTQLAALPARIAMTRAYNAQLQGDLSATMKYAELALQLVPEGDLFSRAQAMITLEVTHWTRGDLEAARSALQDWMSSMQTAGNFVFVVASAFALADILVAQGCLREAITTYQQALTLAADQGPEAQRITAHHYLGLAMLYHEMGQDTASSQHLQKAEELGKQTTLVDWPYRWLIDQARLKESTGDLEAALVLLEQARHRYVKTVIPDTRPIDALKANLYLKQGRLDKAEDWVRKRGLSADDALNYLNEFEHLILARVLIAEYQCRQEQTSILQATGLLDRLLKAAEAQSRTGSVIEILLAQAVALNEHGDLSLALASLDHALALAEPEGYVRLFVDEGAPLHLLLMELRSRMERPSSGQDRALFGYVERLVSAFPQAEGMRSTVPHGNQAQLGPEVRAANIMLVEPLSERELEVLRLVAQGLSNPQISQRLVVAISTVKGHNLRIFGKLQVQNRTEAVARARELGLL